MSDIVSLSSSTPGSSPYASRAGDSIASDRTRGRTEHTRSEEDALHHGRTVSPADGRRIQDRLELSPQAREVSHSEMRRRDPGEVRSGLVNRVRGEISAGRYETADKLDIAVDRLIDHASRP